ncbi:MAG: acyltransferase [Muribaculaceae bacterium]|nr:acyltransferase [Muribaculaceae bacterium]
MMVNPSVKEPTMHFKGVDVMKFLMALCVVLIHVIPLSNGWSPSTAVEYVISLAVPFFFVSSGFLLQNKIEKIGDCESYQTIKKYAFRIWKMYFCWIAIYIPLCMWGYQFDEGHTMAQYGIIQIRSFLLMGEIKYSWPTWYLYSLGFAAVFFMLAKRFRIPLVLILICGIAGVLCQYIFTHFSLASLPKFACSSLSRILIGSGYLMIGVFLRKHIDCIKPLYVICAYVASIGLFVTNLPFSDLIGSVAVFGTAFLMKIRCNERIAEGLRGESLWIFLIHMYVLTPLALNEAFSNPWLLYVVVCLICIVIAGFLYRFSLSSRGKFLKKLV